ncbi:hypothetical protein TREES_T100004898 [Tupaia chinensis]|uniref:Uncharacterized protein n=1 Tax=Tupaia chinensis TaxID=246437 RepID=L9LDB1_TUPCH|nr:hypothetical protein TREES_T100004898 [Tupaia chinensis]
MITSLRRLSTAGYGPGLLRSPSGQAAKTMLAHSRHSGFRERMSLYTSEAQAMNRLSLPTMMLAMKILKNRRYPWVQELQVRWRGEHDTVWSLEGVLSITPCPE